jgi:hypothetical protein
MHWFILLIPLFVAWFAKFILKDTITWKEMGVQMAVSCLIVGLVLGGGMYSQTQDTEIYNGRVVKKYQDRVSCSHSYSCNCRTVSSGSGKNRTTSTVCDTCYEHSWDYNWVVEASYGDHVNINRVDRQGTKEPPRFTQVQIDEPFSQEHSFTNYIKAVPESIFSEEQTCSDEQLAMVPNYPRVHDYYRINRVQNNGVPLKNYKAWNDGLNEVSKYHGASLEVNPIIQFVKTNDPTYEYALTQKWLGGKKNDVTVIFGVSEYPTIDFVRVVSWENEELKHYLREQLSLFDTIDDEYREYALHTIKENIGNHYKRMQMADYEYLKDQIDPPMWSVITGFILALLLSGGLTYYFHRCDPFNDGYRFSRRNTRFGRKASWKNNNRGWRS